MDEWMKKLSSRRPNQPINHSLPAIQDSPSRETKWFETEDMTLSPSVDHSQLLAPTMPTVWDARDESWTSVPRQVNTGSVVLPTASVSQNKKTITPRNFSSLCVGRVVDAATPSPNALLPGNGPLGWGEMRNEMVRSAIFIDKDTRSPKPHWWSSFLGLIPKPNRMSTLSAVFSALDRTHFGDNREANFKQGIAFLGLRGIQTLGTPKHHTIHFIVFSVEELYSQLSSEAHPLLTFQLSPLEIPLSICPTM